MDDTPDPIALSIGDLAERADVSRRTIRFYVQRGLLAPPHGGGRGSHYTGAHLERLLAVKRLQEVGIPLEAILQRLGPPAPTDTPAPIPEAPASAHPKPTAPRSTGEVWHRHAVAPGVELLVREGALSPDAIPALVATARLMALRDQLSSEPHDQTPEPDD